MIFSKEVRVIPLNAMLLDLAAALRNEREAIITEWLKTLGSGTRPAESGLTEKDLRDHMAHLLDDLSHQLQSAVNKESEAAALKHAETHGDSRWTQRYQLHELLREIASLRTIVIDRVVRYGDREQSFSADAKSTAHKIVHRFFDSFMVDSASLFAARQQHATGERQRQQLAQELHDGACQHLQGTALLVNVLARKVNDSEIKKELERIVELIGEGVEEVRAVAHGLSPLAVHMNGGLQEAVEELAQKTRASLACLFECSTRAVVPAGVALHLYRIAQEAVSNALKHSGGSKIVISLSESGDDFVLSVTDDGKGYVSTEHEFHGMGLHNIRHRARVISGTCRIESIPGAGTCVTCSVAKSASESTDWQ